MKELADIIAIIASCAAIIAPTAAVFGYAPRIGPGRALSLGIYSRLFLRADRVSQRTEWETCARGF